jgi:predicted ATPase
LDTEIDLVDIEDDYKDRSKTAKDLARMPFLREIGALQRSYGDGLDSNSHGEGFIKLFKERFVGEGLYLLDEPEAPLSPNRQLSMLALIKTMVDQHGQFIIATHSPILLAYPGAKILSFDGGKIHEESYDSLEQVITMKTFMNHPEAYLRHLME